MKTVLTSKVKILITFILFTSKIHSAGDEIQICTKSILEHKLIIITFKDKSNQDIKLNAKFKFNNKETTKKIPIEFLYYIYQKNGEERNLTQEEMNTIGNELIEGLKELEINKIFTDLKNDTLNYMDLYHKFKKYFKEFIQSANITLNNNTTPNILPVIPYKKQRFTYVIEESGGLSFIENVNDEYERYRKIIDNNEDYKWDSKCRETFLKQDPDPQKIQIITTHMIGTPDVKNLEFYDEDRKQHLNNITELHRIRIFYKQGEEFKIHTTFDKPNIKGHKKSGKYSIELPIEIYYLKDNLKNSDGVLEYIKKHLNNVIKDKTLDFNKLKENFNGAENHLLINFDGEYNDVFSINNNVYVGGTKERVDDDIFVHSVIVSHPFYEEYIPKYTYGHFKKPNKLFILIRTLENEIDDKNIKKSDKGDKATRTIKTLSGTKGKDFKIPTKTQDKNNKKGKTPSIQTPNETPKSNQCCKCCGCCPCCKQKT